MKRLLRRRRVQELLARLVVAYAGLLAKTMRWRIDNLKAAQGAVASPQGAIALFWHGRIGQAIACASLLGGKPRRVMISLSRDGDFISIAAERLKVPVIRGSTRSGPASGDKRGGRAFREAVDFLRSGGAVLLTPDGPRGPREVLSMGAVRLATAARAPTFLAGLAARPSIAISTWDGARVPLPFARGALVIVGPLEPASVANGAELEARRSEWQRRLCEAQATAEARVRSRASCSPALMAYRIATFLAAPFAPAVLEIRARAGKEDRERRGERLGRPSRERPQGRLFWLHGASVGEALSLLPLVTAIARPNTTLLVTSGTTTAADVLRARLPTCAIHQYAPLDTPGAAADFLDHWRPAAAVFSEGELWPNLLLAAVARGIPLALVSAAMSAESFRAWSRAPGMARSLLSAFDLILARDDLQAHRLRSLGGRIGGLSDFKFAAESLPADRKALAEVKAGVAGRRLVLAASTHPGEEELLLRAWRRATEACETRPLLVIAPRHPSRGPEVLRAAQGAGFAAGLRSGGGKVGGTDVYIADTVGELGLFYRLAAFAFVGGSLVPGVGGHNPLEPARVGAAILAGPFTDDWPAYRDLAERGGARLLRSDDDLAAFLRQALDEPDRLREMAGRALVFVEAKDAEARAGLAAVITFLNP